MKFVSLSRVWLVGRFLDKTEREPGDGNWSIEGIYTTEATARSHLQSGWFIFSMPVDEPAPEGALDPPDFEQIE